MPLAESHFPVLSAAVQAVRSDYRQLAQWYSYVYTQLDRDNGVTSGGIDVINNRITIGAIDVQSRDRIVDRLVRLKLPCDLVVVAITGPNRSY